jgi:hypothetical protein
MATQEIRATNWDLFCRRFFEEHRGALMLLEVVYHEGHTELLARDLPLQEMRFEKTASCSDIIHLKLGEAQHQIVDPIHLRLKESTGQPKVLLIDAETGSVELTFSSGRIGAILDELERG